MFGIFVQYSTRPIYDVSMNLFCWPPSIDIFNILPGFLWQPLLIKAKKNPKIPSRPVRRLGIHLKFSLIAGSVMAESGQNLHHQSPLNTMNIKAGLI